MAEGGPNIIVEWILITVFHVSSIGTQWTGRRKTPDLVRSMPRNEFVQNCDVYGLKRLFDFQQGV
ncbi:hypothetical protein BofuT4_uP008420.1 [Botrytis cinerea T4]|uniref:Uncharacterized protein n=1 Tax=Botryotinia fuckeliana (strain T4) TaxID=999810 RepID=G2XX47_BOTF4|nr:hypothetical protein BofuT4_uP008420.1 [Botrytis cinerea T4]